MSIDFQVDYHESPNEEFKNLVSAEKTKKSNRLHLGKNLSSFF